jgi:hypothetical protein
MRRTCRGACTAAIGAMLWMVHALDTDFRRTVGAGEKTYRRRFQCRLSRTGVSEPVRLFKLNIQLLRNRNPHFNDLAVIGLLFNAV